MALGLTQPPKEMSTRKFPGGKDGRCIGLTTLPPSSADCLEIWKPQPPGILRACNGIALPLPFNTWRQVVNIMPHPLWTLWRRERFPDIAVIQTPDHTARSLVTV
jgi:hypothetical protein